MINKSLTNSVASSDRHILIEDEERGNDPYADPYAYSKVNQLLSNAELPTTPTVEDVKEQIQEEKRH